MSLAENLARIAAFLTADTSGNLTATNTPAQFDNSLAVPTTAFLQRALGNLSGMRSAAANLTLTVADAGKEIIVANGVTVTLPLLSTCPAGTAFSFVSSGAGARSIQRQSTDQFSIGGGTQNSVGLEDGGHCVVVSNGIYWNVMSSRATFDIGVSLTTNGYQKFPNGLILQWGGVPSIAGNGVQTVSYPLAFPNACLSIVAIAGASNIGASAISGVNASAANKTAFSAYNTSASVATQPGLYLAVGY